MRSDLTLCSALMASLAVTSGPGLCLAPSPSLTHRRNPPDQEWGGSPGGEGGPLAQSLLGLQDKTLLGHPPPPNSLGWMVPGGSAAHVKWTRPLGIQPPAPARPGAPSVPPQVSPAGLDVAQGPALLQLSQGTLLPVTPRASPRRTAQPSGTGGQSWDRKRRVAPDPAVVGPPVRTC